MGAQDRAHERTGGARAFPSKPWKSLSCPPPLCFCCRSKRSLRNTKNLAAGVEETKTCLFFLESCCKSEKEKRDDDEKRERERERRGREGENQSSRPVENKTLEKGQSSKIDHVSPLVLKRHYSRCSCACPLCGRQAPPLALAIGTAVACPERQQQRRFNVDRRRRRRRPPRLPQTLPPPTTTTPTPSALRPPSCERPKQQQQEKQEHHPRKRDTPTRFSSQASASSPPSARGREGRGSPPRRRRRRC